jgi:benzylsuccinate CoA-transferase BbsF subunit
MYPTGDPDRAPVRCTEPTAYAHGAGEAVTAALTAIASGVPQVVDLSLAEAMLITQMTAPARYPQEHNRGKRRGERTGRTREIWTCQDGYVSFGLRGGKARLKNLALITELVGEEPLTSMDWTAYSPNALTDDELDAIATPIQRYFDRHTMAELYAIAVETGLMLAPANSPKELLNSEQLAARSWWREVGDIKTFPGPFVIAPGVEVRGPAPAPATTTPLWEQAAYDWRRTPASKDAWSGTKDAWGGTTIVEFGSGAAGPIAARYFADAGATVIRVESKTRPDFLRNYSEAGPDASLFFAGLNAGKLGLTLNMKDPRGVDIAKRLIMQADAVSENFAPKAMKGFGLDYATLAADKPDLVMVSACLQGQTGPHKDYPGFGGQGAALSGYNFLTGWPDRAPLGPAGTITDSLAPRYVAAALAAGLLHRRATGHGVHLDLAQVESALFTLGPWLLDYAVNGHVYGRDGNRSDRAAPHGAFQAADDGEVSDRWVALAVWDDEEWARFAKVVGIDDDGFATFAQRKEREDELESLVTAWTQTRPAAETAQLLQSEGLDAHPVNDWADVHTDPHLVHRKHFVPLQHPVIGEHLYEESGFRLGQSDFHVRGPGPTLGQHNEQLLTELLGMTRTEIDDLAGDGVLS